MTLNKHETAYCCLSYDDDNKVSHTEAGRVFFNDFIIGVKSYMRVNVTLDSSY